LASGGKGVVEVCLYFVQQGEKDETERFHELPNTQLEAGRVPVVDT